jgi:uncharacterized protein (TIGR00730 family)
MTGQEPEKNSPLAIGVFCGSSHGGDPAYAESARDLGRLIAAGGHTLVFGGGNVGLMGEVARAARDGGARVVGYLPECLQRPEIPFREGAELILTADLQARKLRMMDHADAFIILPGGLGTLDEYFEVLTGNQLGVIAKPVILVDTLGYFTPLVRLIDHVFAHGFAHGPNRVHEIVPDAQAALTLLSRLPAAPPPA